MANKEFWVVTIAHYFERNWDKWENAIQIIFTLEIVILPLPISYIISEENTVMHPTLSNIAGFSLMVLFYTAIFFGWLLIRNSGKTTKQKLDNIDQKLDEISSTLKDTNSLLGKLIKKMDTKKVNKNGQPTNKL